MNAHSSVPSPSTTQVAMIPKTKKRLKRLGLAAIVMGTVLAMPSLARAFSFNSPLLDILDNLTGGLTGDLIAIVEEAQGYVEDVLNSDGRELLSTILDDYLGLCDDSYIDAPPGLCSPITVEGDTVADILEATAGVLGVSDPIEYSTDIRDQIDKSNKASLWGYYLNGTQAVDMAINEADRGVTSLQGTSLLSKSGQEKMEKAMADQAEMANAILEVGAQAMQAESTQDALKMLAWVEAQKAVMEQSQSTTEHMARLDTQISNLNLSNISETLDQEQNDKQVQQYLNTDGFVGAAMGTGLF